MTARRFSSARPPRSRGWLRPTLFALFVIVPLLEIWVLIQVGQVIGALWTVALLIADSLLGVWLVRREGRRAWDGFVSAQRAGQVPGREIADGALILVGGTLLLTPGFVTDLLGFALLLPISRPIARKALTAVVLRRLTGLWTVAPGGFRPGGPHGRPRSGRAGQVIPGEVIADSSDSDSQRPPRDDGPAPSNGRPGAGS